MHHFEPDYTTNVFTISKAIGFLNQNEVAAMYEVLSARLKQLDAEASKNFSAEDKVKWVHRKGNRIYSYGGTILTSGPTCTILATTGGQWRIPARMLSKA